MPVSSRPPCLISDFCFARFASPQEKERAGQDMARARPSALAHTVTSTDRKCSNPCAYLSRLFGLPTLHARP